MTNTTAYLTEVPRLTELVQGDEVKITMGIPGLNATITEYQIVEEIDATRGWLTTRHARPLNGWEADKQLHFGAGHPSGWNVRTLVSISEPLERP
jgi:hypothetical protein